MDTRADVPATEEGAKIKDITVFFFNTTGFIVGTPKYKGVAADIAKPITTNTDASQVVVIANLGGDETTTGKKLAGVSSIDQLKTKVFSSVTHPRQAPYKRQTRSWSKRTSPCYRPCRNDYGICR